MDTGDSGSSSTSPVGDNRNGINADCTLRAALGDTIAAVVLSGDTASERIREVSAAGLTMLRKPLKAIRLRALLNHEFARRSVCIQIRSNRIDAINEGVPLKPHHFHIPKAERETRRILDPASIRAHGDGCE
jgi:hypothetical protein